jgi:putative membrane protein
MIIELFIAFLAGTIAGLITGLLPGIHINLVASFILVFVLSHANLALPLAIFIIVLSVTHTVIDFIPTTLLGVPNEDNFLSILPAHKLVRQGKALEAIRYALLGCIISLPIFLALIPVYVYLLPHFYIKIESIIPFVLVLSSLYLILRGKNVLACLCIFLLSGLLGFYAFNLPVKEPLLPLLSGLFGISSLLSGLSDTPLGIKQSIQHKPLSKRKIIRPTVVASIVAPLFSFFPAIGAGHISLFSSELANQTPKQFIFLNGFVSALTMNLSVLAAYSIGKTRTGTAVAINSLLSPFSSKELFILIISIIISTILVYFLAIKISNRAVLFYNKVPYTKIAMFTLAFVIIVNIFLTNSYGLVVFGCASALGYLTILLGVSRIQLMGSLLLPTILYYFV